MKACRKIVWVMAIVCAVVSVPLAGTVSLSWNPVTEGDPTGYRVYYGTSPGNYTQNVDVGNVTQTTVGNLNECTVWYFAVKAYNEAGDESENYSEELSGLPRPSIQSVTPNSLEPGRRVVLDVVGFNFETGAIADFLDANITVNSTTITGCQSGQIDITVSSATSPGTRDLDITNPNLVYGVGNAVLTIESIVAPTVSSMSPADGATAVAASVQPTVQFSEAMDASSITTSTVRLLDPNGQPVAQASGSPSLSTDGSVATIVPSSDLNAGATYRIEVVGGSAGVRDLAGHTMATSVVQSSGFTVDLDSDAPVISAVATENLASTSTDIVWTTDEPADSEVEYRRLGQSTWASSGVDSNLVTSHRVTLTGLSPDEIYEYRVMSADEVGNVSASATDTFTTLSNNFTYMRFEAEFGELDQPMQEGQAATALMNGYIDTPNGTPTGTSSNPSGLARYRFNAAQSATWNVWTRVYAPAGNADRVFERMDNGTRQSIQIPSGSVWSWVAARSYTLTAGAHVFELGGQDPRARVDRIIITDDPDFIPTEMPEDDNSAPGAVTSLANAAGDMQVLLDWIFPADADINRAIVRYRTDGTLPTSIYDGQQAGEVTGTPNTPGSLLHTGLTNGTTYSYGVFVVDAEGNVSRVETTEATPVASSIGPGDVNGLVRADRK